MSNLLLSALPANEYERIFPLLEEITLKYNSTIMDPGGSTGYVYFPNSGIMSMLAGVEDDSSLIAWVVGREGMAGGLCLLLGAKEAPVRAVVQGKGTAMRMKAEDFKGECGNGSVFAGMLQHFAYSILVQVLQSTACYRFHPVEKRLARWLLMTGDRMETNQFQMTQKFLSNMVGVRRESVTNTAGILKEKGLITYQRGQMEIADRPGLEAAACKCYSIIRKEEMSFLNSM